MLEAFRSSLAIEHVIVPSDTHPDPEIAELCESNGVRLFGLHVDAFTNLSDARTPQPAIAVVSSPSLEFDDRFELREGLILVLVDVSDPGNVGTLVRTAEAAGCIGVLVTPETADVVSPKVVRASAGSILRVPIAEVPSDEVVPALGRLDATTIATAMEGVPFEQAPIGRGGVTALLLGNEAHGLPGELLATVQHIVSIPMAGAVESLNVATSGAVLAFDHARRLRERTP